MISRLEDNPHSGFEKLDFIPDKYKVAYIWKHYWAIFVVYEDDRYVKIDMSEVRDEINKTFGFLGIKAEDN